MDIRQEFREFLSEGKVLSTLDKKLIKEYIKKIQQENEHGKSIEYKKVFSDGTTNYYKDKVKVTPDKLLKGEDEYVLIFEFRHYNDGSSYVAGGKYVGYVFNITDKIDETKKNNYGDNWGGANIIAQRLYKTYEDISKEIKI